MQFLPIIFAVILIVISIVLIVVAFHLIRVLIQLNRALRAVNTVVDASQVNLKETLESVFVQLLSKAELSEELIDDIAMRTATGGRRGTKKKGEKKQLFKGL